MSLYLEFLSRIHIYAITVGHLGHPECSKTIYLYQAIIFKAFDNKIKECLGKRLGFCQGDSGLFSKQSTQVGMIKFIAHS